VAITWTKVFSVGFEEFGCGAQGIACCGDGRALMSLEEVGNDSSPNHNPDENLFRRFKSVDYGANWSELPIIYHDASALVSFQGKMLPLSADIVLQAMQNTSLNDIEYDPDVSVIARSNDGGTTFASVVAQAVYDTIVDGINKLPKIYGFVRGINNRILAVGRQHTLSGQATTAMYLTSEDNGVSFANPRYINIGNHGALRNGVHLGAGVIVLASERSGSGRAFILRSTDNGDTWAQVLMPDTGTGTGLVSDVAYAGGNVVAVGSRPAGSTPRIWYSTDDGVTWNDANIGTWSPDYINTVIAINETTFIAGAWVNPTDLAAGHKPFAISTDGGATWSHTLDSYGSAFTASQDYLVNQFAVLPDGNVVAVVQTILNFTETGNEIWLGTIAEITVDQSLCATAEVPEVPTAATLPVDEVICPCMTDSAKIYDLSGTATTVFEGLLHLEGETVDVKADNVYIGSYVVQGGIVTITEPAYWRCEIGLHYDSTVTTMRPAIDGKIVEGLPRKWVKKWLRLFESLGGKIDGELIHYPPEGSFQPYTGDVEVYSELGPTTDERITIVQDQPYCITILAIFGEIEFGDHG